VPGLGAFFQGRREGRRQKTSTGGANLLKNNGMWVNGRSRHRTRKNSFPGGLDISSGKPYYIGAFGHSLTTI
jgi:hypothetical protein